MAAKKAKNQNINETRSKNKQKVALRRKVLRSTRSCRGNSADRIIQLIPLFWGSRNQPVAGPRPWCLDRSLLAIVAIRFRLESIPSRTTALSLSLSRSPSTPRVRRALCKKKTKTKTKNNRRPWPPVDRWSPSPSSSAPRRRYATEAATTSEVSPSCQKKNNRMSPNVYLAVPLFFFPFWINFLLFFLSHFEKVTIRV